MSQGEKDHVGFCTHCSTLIKDFEGLTKCPTCGTTGLPCSFENQVNVRVNTHELRVLCIWAENYAHSIKETNLDIHPENASAPDTVYAIAARLRRQLPDTSLTMADEFDSLKEKFPNVRTNHPAADSPEHPEMYQPELGSGGSDDDA